LVFPWRTPFGSRAASFEVRGNARIRATVPLLLLFHEGVFLQRKISRITAHYSVRLDKPA
jgi:hypothetical protein